MAAPPSLLVCTNVVHVSQNRRAIFVVGVPPTTLSASFMLSINNSSHRLCSSPTTFTARHNEHNPSLRSTPPNKKKFLLQFIKTVFDRHTLREGLIYHTIPFGQFCQGLNLFGGGRCIQMEHEPDRFETNGSFFRNP